MHPCLPPACTALASVPHGDVHDQSPNLQALEAETRRTDFSGLEAEVVDVQRSLAEHRNRIGVLKQETEAQLASANQLSDQAQRQEADLQAVSTRCANFFPCKTRGFASCKDSTLAGAASKSVPRFAAAQAHCFCQVPC